MYAQLNFFSYSPLGHNIAEKFLNFKGIRSFPGIFSKTTKIDFGDLQIKTMPKDVSKKNHIFYALYTLQLFFNIHKFLFIAEMCSL